MLKSAQLAGERGDVVLGWLTRLLVVISVVGVTLIDGVSVVKAHYGAQGDATSAATAASAAYATRHNKADAYAAALQVAASNDETLDKRKFHVDASGGVTLTLIRTADTVVLDQLPPLRRFGIATSVGTAAAPAPVTNS